MPKADGQAIEVVCADGSRSDQKALAVDAVVFDMDGLLLDTESLARRALRLAGNEVGIELTDAFCALLIGVPADGCRLLLFEHHGEAAPADRLFAAATRHLRALIEGGAMQLKPGVIELLGQLDKAGLARVVATSSARDKAFHHLAHAGIAGHFGAVVTRDDVKRGKPHPDIFLRAAEVAGAEPGRCIALEDSYNGVRAAHAAGMPVIMVPDLLPPNEEMHQKCIAIAQDLHAVSRMLTAQKNRLVFSA